MEIRILLLMVLLHIIDDFVFQPICLSKLKQKSWWESNPRFSKMYEDDYKMALAIHSISWSIMISLPSILATSVSGSLILLTVVVNSVLHYYIDNSKANLMKINLVEDQTYHFIQIVITWFFTVVLCGL